MTARAAFRQDDLMRAIKAVRQAGMEVVEVELSFDSRSITIKTNAGPPGSGGAINPWDKEFQ